MKDNIIDTDDWLFEITPKNKLLSLNLKEVWQYRDLLMLFVKRDVVTVYKQTILGPLWYLIQPLFTSVIFTLIFNNVANISTGSVPPFLFNLAGITIWNYFKECLTATSNTFTSNAGIFGKVYFPRIIMPFSIVISNLLKFGIQLFIFIAFFIYYYVNGASISLNKFTFLFPFMVLIMGMLGLGLGMIISSMVTKYRDLKILIGFGMQLLMYISAVMYPVSFFVEKLPKYAWIVEYNPLSFVIETVRFMLLNTGKFNISMFIYAISITVIILISGIVIFNRAEKNFIDTV
ncbi:ABC transporter permease [Lutibacter flavus]|uniref:Transport permease protein n=1 Tax=Lutibacter flavus TaxID=691689 RepID=A0A238VQY9_9FLAO|nr:ABC transporter permease [Lutibacter flavus]SNR36638.1 lipopolysaccharide transport system permease protein [Lutibacter flavus]